MVAFLRHTGERERLDSFIITLSCCLWTDAHVHQPSWSSLASVLWKCKVITGVYLGQKKRTQFQAQTLFLCCFSMVYFWLQNSSLSVPNPLLREWGGSSLCLSVYVSVSLSLIFANDCEEERRTEIQSSFWWFFQNPVWTRGPPPPRSPGSSHLAIAGAPRIDHPASPANQSDITLKNTIIAQTSNSLGHNIFFAFRSKVFLLIVRKRARALDL